MQQATATTTTGLAASDPHNLATAPRRGLLGGFLALAGAVGPTVALVAPAALPAVAGGDAALFGLTAAEAAPWPPVEGGAA